MIFAFPWDVTFSFNKRDCSEYNFCFLGEDYYSKRNDLVPQRGKSTDLYYIGANKGNREQKVMQVYHAARQSHLICDFNIVDREKHAEKIGLRYYRQWIPYIQSLQDMINTNCILEVLQEGQTAQSARYYEAVCYNKKLLTNNPYIKELSFYNPKCMQFFNNVNDIDFSWVKEKSDINYNYHNEFSPVHIIEVIEQYFRG